MISYYKKTEMETERLQKFNDSCTGKGEISFLSYAEEIARLEKMKAKKEKVAKK